jgi:hypothetical protein
MLWQATAKNCPLGDLGKFSNEEIAIMCDWEGDSDELVVSLFETGWIDLHEEHRLVVHDWHKHAPKFIKGVAARSGGFLSEENALRVTDPKSATLSSLLRVGNWRARVLPNLTKPNLTNEEGVPSSCTETCDPDKPESLAPCQPRDDSPVVMKFPVEGSVPPIWKLRQSRIDKMADLFPSLDVVHQCRLALQWLEDNPTKRKTANGMPRFLTGWMKREVDRGPVRNNGPSQKKTLAQRNREAIEQWKATKAKQSQTP